MSVLPQLALKMLIGLAGAASLATLFRLFERHIDGRPLLPYEPRRAVPWNSLAPLLMLSPLGLALWSALQSTPGGDLALETAALTAVAAAGATASAPAALMSAYATAGPALEVAQRAGAADSLAAGIWAQATATLLLAAGCNVFLVVAFGATRHDLGLPCDWSECRRDVKIGATAWAASLVPIYASLIVLNEVLQPTEGHPLIEELMVNHSWPMMAAAAFAAMVAAPLYEETAFRVALQGWLERRETHPPQDSTMQPGESPRDVASAAESHPGVSPAPPATLGQAPPGWTPIVISSVLFGLAHYGHGVSPLPLILLGVVLGYLYRQTHRVLPCIVCHLMFNGFTFLLLGLNFAAAG